MKKKLIPLLSLLLCAALLCGCGHKIRLPVPTPPPSAEPAPDSTPKPYVPPTAEREGLLDVIPFDLMPYEHPDLEDLSRDIDAVGEALDRGADYAELEPLLDACGNFCDTYYTMYSIAFIRSCQDMTDEFYADEYALLDEESADLSQLMEQLYFRCGMSSMAQELEEKYFWPGFAEEYADDSNAFYDDEMVALLQEESNLVAEYRALVANPTVTLSTGKEVDFYTALDEFDPSSSRYADLVFSYYEQYNHKLGGVYIEMIKNRQLQAAHAGYDSYEELAFDHGFQRDYSPELAEEYLQGIKEHIVPLYRQLAPYGYLPEVEPMALDAQRLEDILRDGVRSMGEDVQDTYEFMVQYRLYDITYDPLKAKMSFQTYLPSYQVPFLFMNSEGGLGDITTFSHEFGHYLDGFLNYEEDETIDLAECYSQAMELLMLTRLDGTLSDWELDSLYEMKMLDVLGMYVQQGAFAEFEHIVYASDPDQLSQDYLNETFLGLCQDYGFCEDGLEDIYRYVWMDITHFFEQPFYVITYPVSHDVAMQIFQLEQARPGEGLDTFLEMIPRQSPNMVESAELAGLQSPFTPGRLRSVAASMREILLPDGAENAA